jgi:hypothetical protein
MFMRRRGIGLLGAAAIGGTAYAVGSSRSRNQAEMQQMESQQQQLAQQQQQMAAQQQYLAVQQASKQTPAAPPPAAGLTQEQKIAQLQQLATLRQSGVLTDTEFEREKQKILAQYIRNWRIYDKCPSWPFC